MIWFRSINDLDALIKDRLHLIPQVDAVAGVPRSGMLPATMLALYLGKPLLSIEQIGALTTNSFSSRVPLSTSIKKVLVIDDSCNRGNALRKVKKHLSGIKDIEFIYAAAYVTESGKSLVDLYFEQLEQPRLFEWNIMDHDILGQACVDLDGVLCIDPTNEENDDGENYKNFLINAKPKFIPTHTIKAIVTCRLEKYRNLTVDWLDKHGIKYRHLYMMNLPDAATRRALNNYAQYKANIYREENAQLFIESNKEQALRIYSYTRKPVYCVSSNKLLP